MTWSSNHNLRFGDMYVDFGNRPARSIRNKVVLETGMIAKTCASLSMRRKQGLSGADSSLSWLKFSGIIADFHHAYFRLG